LANHITHTQLLLSLILNTSHHGWHCTCFFSEWFKCIIARRVVLGEASGMELLSMVNLVGQENKW